MEILVSALAVMVALSCLAALIWNEWIAKKKSPGEDNR